MPKHRPTPITVWCRDGEQAEDMTATNPDSRALTTGAGTLKFHMLLAQHGAGEFQTLFVPLALRGQFKTPAGGIVKYAEGVEA